MPQSEPWVTRIRDHATERIIESASHPTPEAALAAYRHLLARPDLDGRAVAAVFKPPRDAVEPGNVSTLFSRFDRAVGDGRYAPDDPRLDPWLTLEEGQRVAYSLPPKAAPPHDWERDARPIRECLVIWQGGPGSQHAARAARTLRVPRTTYDGWLAGRSVGQEGMLRRMMTEVPSPQNDPRRPMEAP